MKRKRKFQNAYSHEKPIQGGPLDPQEGCCVQSPDPEGKLMSLISAVQWNINASPKHNLHI